MKRFAPTIGLALLEVALFSAAGCGGLPPGEADQGAIATPAWSVASCGNAQANAAFTGHYGTVVGGVPTFTSPRTYNTCFKSYVVDLHNLDSAYAGLGAGGGGNAMLSVGWGEAVPTNQADCEAAIAGAIFYKFSNNAWVPLTGQLATSGSWSPDPFSGVYRCIPPSVTYSPLTAGTTYRAAGVARPYDSSDAPTAKVLFQNFAREVIH
jgi:hypothetical protein